MTSVKVGASRLLREVQLRVFSKGVGTPLLGLSLMSLGEARSEGGGEGLAGDGHCPDGLLGAAPPSGEDGALGGEAAANAVLLYLRPVAGHSFVVAGKPGDDKV